MAQFFSIQATHPRDRRASSSHLDAQARDARQLHLHSACPAGAAAPFDAQENHRGARPGAPRGARAEAADIRARLEHELDLVIDAGSCGVEPSTVIDLTTGEPRVLRQGKGSLAPFAVERV